MALAIFAPIFFSVWSKRTITVGSGFSALFGFYIGLYVISSCFNILMYAFNFVEMLAWLSPVGLALSYLIAWQLSGFGPISVVLGNVASLLIGLGVGLYFYFEIFRKLRTPF
jgi:hypothetical protein